MRVIPPNCTSLSFMFQKVCVVVAGCLSYVWVFSLERYRRIFDDVDQDIKKCNVPWRWLVSALS